MFTHCIHLVEAPVVQITVRYQGRTQDFPKGGVETSAAAIWSVADIVYISRYE